MRVGVGVRVMWRWDEGGGWRVEVECGRARVGASRLTSPAHEVDHEIERPSCAGVRGAQG